LTIYLGLLTQFSVPLDLRGHIGATLAGFGFRWVQGSIYVCENEDMANLMDALTDLLWFPPSVRDVRAFRVEQWSNFTDRVKRRGMAK
jgi:virulence-associated protein VapD